MEVILVVGLILFAAYLQISDFLSGKWWSKSEEQVVPVVEPPKLEIPINKFIENMDKSHFFLNLSTNKTGPNIPESVKKTLRSLAMTGASKKTKTQHYVPYNRIPSHIYNAHKDALAPHIRRRNVTYYVAGSPLHKNRVLLGNYFNGQTLQPEAWYNIRNPIQ